MRNPLKNLASFKYQFDGHWRIAKLYLAPRFFIADDSIIYYAAVAAVRMNQSAGTMQIAYKYDKDARFSVFRLERDKFPTNARKDFKIIANKQAKFDRVSQLLLNRIRELSPKVDIKSQ